MFKDANLNSNTMRSRPRPPTPHHIWHSVLNFNIKIYAFFLKNICSKANETGLTVVRLTVYSLKFRTCLVKNEKLHLPLFWRPPAKVEPVEVPGNIVMVAALPALSIGKIQWYGYQVSTKNILIFFPNKVKLSFQILTE